jgi:hypothetical protein
VAAAARKVVPVIIDCSEKGSQDALMAKYGVEGYPTVVYVDPEGKKLKEMGSRDAKAIIGDIEGLAAQYAGQPSLFQNSVSGAIAAAKASKTPLPVVVYLAEEAADMVKTYVKVAKDLSARKGKFLFVLGVANKPALEANGLEKGPAAVVLDPTSEKPRETPIAKIPIDAASKPADLTKSLDEAAKKMKASGKK